MISKQLSLAAALAVTLCATASAQTWHDPQEWGFPKAETFDTVKPAAQTHLDAAKKAAGSDLGPVLYANCNAALPKDARVKVPNDRPAVPEPAKVFDNLIFLGTKSVTSWAVTTKDGIILIDTLNNPDEAKQYIEGGLRKLGLDPAQIKYIIVTHAHGDHFGGAQYLADTYHAHVMMSQTDWDYMPNERFHPNRGVAPKHDMVLTDGQKFTFGGETITLYMTPGHTPGTMSLLVPVTDNGKPHVAAIWGGTGLALQHYEAYSNSAERFAKMAAAAGADIILSNHPVNDFSFQKIAQLKTRGPNDPNPFVVGKATVQRQMAVFDECAKIFMAQSAS